MKNSILPFFVLMLPLYLNAQFEPIQQFSVKDGLPSAVVYDCLQDKQGFMWFATAAGLARFDGTNFKVFTTKEGITNNEVLQIFLDATGSIWIIPYGGQLCIYDPVSNRILNNKNTPDLGKIETNGDDVYFRNSVIGPVSVVAEKMIRLERNKIIVTKIDQLSDFWPLNRDTIICFKKTNSGSGIYYYTKEGRKLSDIGSSSIAWHYKSTDVDWGNTKIRWYYGKPDTIGLYKFSGNKTIELKNKYRFPFPVNGVQKHGSRFYIGTANGVFITDSLLNTEEHFFKGISISKSFTDRDGNEWFTTLSGEGVLLRMKNGVFRFNKGNGIPQDNVSTIEFDGRNRMYCGDAGGNFYSFQASNSGIRTKMAMKFSELVRGIEFVNGEYVVFTSNKLSTGSKNSYFFVHAIKSALIDAAGNILIGGGRGLFVLRKGETNAELITSNQLFRSLCYYSGDLYFGNNKGLYRISSLYPYSEEHIGKNSRVLNLPVNHLLATRDGLLWVATNTSGIYAMKKGRIMVHLQSDSGSALLSSNICKKIYAEDSGNVIWVATNKGINKIQYSVKGDLIDAHISVISTAEGLNDDDVNDICVSNGKVYAATIKGICVFPENLQPIVVPMVITGIRIKNYELPDSLMEVKEEYILDFRQNNISISFAGLSFTGNRRLQYQYRFFSETGDTAWTTTNATSAEFGELSPGSYTFQVKTGLGNIREIRFYISTPFWRTYTFYILLLFIVFAVVGQIARTIIRNIRKKELENTATNQKFSELELKALQAQMNPHFVFNAMNTLQNYILKHESEQASEYLSSFSRLMRLFLDASRNKFISIATEIELLRHYMELEQSRLNNSFAFIIDCDEDIDPDTEIPSVIIQPFVENAILHGLRHREDGNGKLEIVFNVSGNDVICRVSDNGIGRAEAAKVNQVKGGIYKSQGMQLIDEKIKTLKAIVNIDIGIHAEDIFTNGLLSKTVVTICFKNIIRT